ncbi:hypothetical protein RHECNPAF_880013 [Rhizobium etli CNPAF512]|nr:hypothetical protein RHECNPAF_880013 [Rhizobium etli CNPAF512]
MAYQGRKPNRPRARGHRRPVRDINRHMTAISVVAQEQSIGLSEVNMAVNHMDQATQQNAPWSNR